MNTTALTTQTSLTTQEASFEAIASLVLDGLTSENSRRAYGTALSHFLQWWNDQGRPPMTKVVVNRYKRTLQSAGLAPSTINLRLTAVRALVREGADNGLIPQHIAAGVARAKGVRAGGRRVGNWLTREQAQTLLDAPNTKTLKGKRDKAILAALLGSGLRRGELAALTFEHIQQREGRWCVVDLVGKGNKTRTVPIPSWCKSAIDQWAQAARIEGGLVFRSMRRGGRMNGRAMSSQAVYDLVREYAGQCGFGDLAAHDLRRTWAKLAHQGGAAIDQIQLSLGHASIQTTERYLGVEQNLTTAPCDVLGLA